MTTNVGGTAASGGFDFQHRVAAWIAIRILAEKDATEIWGLRDCLSFIRCETEQPVDDILVGTAGKGFAFPQIKKNLNLSDDSESEFASAISQFCRQFLVCRDANASRRQWERPLDRAIDRLLLVVGPEASGRIRFGLRHVLDRIRGLDPSQTVSDGALNQDETEALTFTLNHLRNAWRKESKSDPSATEERQLLQLIWLDVLDVQEGGSDERNAKDLLLSSILSREESDKAWALVLEACAGFAANRSGGDRLTLQQLLLGAGVSIKANRSYRADIDKLQKYSYRTAELLADYGYIRLGSSHVKIRRESTDQLVTLSETDSLLVVGEPGSGKSGALCEFAERRLEANCDLVFFAADHVSSTSLEQSTDSVDSKLEAARHRSFKVVEVLLRSAWQALSVLQARSEAPEPEDGQDTNIAHALAKIIDQIGMQIYFASGAFAERQPPESANRSKALSVEQKKRFYTEAANILEMLAKVGVPSVAHHLLETLELFIDFDPRATFLQMSAALQAGSQYGYQHESQAAHLFVRLVERFLADHREIFQDDADCRKALRDALDLFVGWPIALRLVYRLEEIYR